ncbi:MAG: peptidylprolyl isomerase [Gemmataceae bacterium]
MLILRFTACSKPMKKLFPQLLIAALLIFTASAHAAETLDRIIVIVNDGVILESDLDSAIAQAKSELQQRKIADPPDDILRAQVLEHLIQQKVQTERATEAGIRIDDRELNDVIAGIAQRNGMTLAAFADAVKKEGIDYLAMREQIRDQVMISRLRQKEVESRIVVTDQDVDQFLAEQGPDTNTEYRLSHILVAVPDGASPEVRAKNKARAEDLLKQIRGGTPFAQVAIAHSDGQQALQGGDLGWRKATDLPQLFANTAAKLTKGGVSDVIEAAGGFHIIELVDKRGGDTRQTVTETDARHILITTNAVRDDDQARAQARDIYDQLMKGADFAKLAEQYSDDPGSKHSGGDLGWQPPGVFAPEFQAHIDQLKPGEISPPFHTKFGWHIASVVGRRTRDITEDSRRARAREAIMERKTNEATDSWLRRMRDEAYVEYLNKTDADAAAAAKS